MKQRIDFVTNSSSSSFIITNNTDHTIDKYDFAHMLVERILKDAEDFSMDSLSPGESCVVECSDDGYNAIELYIHNHYDDYSFRNAKNDGISIEFYESHH